MRVREATVDDVEPLSAVHEQTWEVAYAHVFPADRLQARKVDRDRWRRSIEEVADDTRAKIFVVEDDAANVIGFASVGPTRDADADCGELYGIYVHPDAWDTGAGRALIDAAEAALVDAGFARATLWVLDDNPRARRFYERAGWHFDGTTKRDTHLGIEVDEVRYAKELRA